MGDVGLRWYQHDRRRRRPTRHHDRRAWARGCGTSMTNSTGLLRPRRWTARSRSPRVALGLGAPGQRYFQGVGDSHALRGLRVLGVAGVVVGAVSEGITGYNYYVSERGLAGEQASALAARDAAIVTAASSILGLALGAVGSAFGPAGTFAGAMLGSYLGSLAGQWVVGRLREDE